MDVLEAVNKGLCIVTGLSEQLQDLAPGDFKIVEPEEVPSCFPGVRVEKREPGLRELRLDRSVWNVYFCETTMCPFGELHEARAFVHADHGLPIGQQVIDLSPVEIPRMAGGAQRGVRNLQGVRYLKVIQERQSGGGGQETLVVLPRVIDAVTATPRSSFW